MTITTYNLTASNGKHIRKATKVVLDDGREIRFTELMTKREAVANIDRLLFSKAVTV